MVEVSFVATVATAAMLFGLAIGFVGGFFCRFAKTFARLMSSSCSAIRRRSAELDAKMANGGRRTTGGI